MNVVPGAFRAVPWSGLRLAGEREHPLADDVALDLVRPGPDRRRLVVEPRPLPAPVAGVVVARRATTAPPGRAPPSPCRAGACSSRSSRASARCPRAPGPGPWRGGRGCASCAAGTAAPRRRPRASRRCSRWSSNAPASSARRSSSSTSWMWITSCRGLMPRSCDSVELAIRQPSFSGPMRWSSGTNTSEKKTSLNSDSSVICRSGRTSTPAARMSTTRYEMPRCFGASGSVRARQTPQSANWA